MCSSPCLLKTFQENCAGQAHTRTASVHSQQLTIVIGWFLICNLSLFLTFLLHCWKAASINKYLPKRLKFFLLTKDYVAQLQLPVQIQTSKKKIILLEKQWKLFDSFSTSTNEIPEYGGLSKKQRPFPVALCFILPFKFDRGKVGFDC